MNFEDTIKRSEIERTEKWDEIIKEVPSLNFDKDWEVKIIPPFAGAIVRFLIFKDGVRICSVYLDWYDRLGCYGSPYYELYPFGNDIKRYSLNETKELLKDIGDMFNA